MAWMGWMKKITKGALLVVPPWIAFCDMGFTVRTVDGVSMKPTLNPDGHNTDFVLLNRWAAASMSYEKGQVVSLLSPKNPKQWLIKRVVALEGDQVKCHSCFEEDVSVPKGHLWVEGDNIDHSLDSNNFGPVSTGLVTAKATYVVWPPSRWGKLVAKDTAGDRVTQTAQVNRGKHFFGWSEE